MFGENINLDSECYRTVAASLQYDVNRTNCAPVNKAEIVKAYENGHIPGEVGIDPNDKTWIAYVYRDVATKKEVNK